MSIFDINIRPLRFSEIDETKGMPPAEWQLDFPKLLRFHFEQPYFYVAVAKLNGKVAGIGNLILNENVAWLGHIIVNPEYRKKGIGLKMTEHLMEYAQSKGLESLLLVATAIGEPLYRKLGFENDSSYIFYTGGKPFEAHSNAQIKKINESDLPEVLKLDFKITGEKRKTFFKRYVQTGFVHLDHTSQQIDGFYLPEMGTGLIIAENEKAGLALLKFRNQKKHDITVVPAENKMARNLLLKNGYKEELIIPRMVFGRRVPWQEEKIYSRATGYSG
jgi:GNAT superfamily N-acetyltransferase